MDKRNRTIMAIISTATVVVSALLVGAIAWDIYANGDGKNTDNNGEVITEKTEAATMTLEEAAAYQKDEIWGRNNETYIIAEPNIYVVTTDDGKTIKSNVNGIDVVIKQSGDAIYMTTAETGDDIACLTAGGDVLINDFFSVRYDFENRTFINEYGEVRAKLKVVEDVTTGRETKAVYDNDDRIIVYYEAGAVNGNDAFTVAFNDVCTDIAYMLVFAYEIIQP